ncbi:MAG TPA: hypothetical protein VI670_21760 [Thermoanaerobaculia bacterium]|jgi:predicted DNA-binding protein
MTREYTLTLKEETIQKIESLAERLGKSPGDVLHDAMLHYLPTPERLSNAERQRLLMALAELRKQPPSRPQEEVERELKELRLARHGGTELKIDDPD